MMSDFVWADGGKTGENVVVAHNPDFKVGDRVQVLAEHWSAFVGTVTKVSPVYCRVSLDNYGEGLFCKSSLKLV